MASRLDLSPGRRRLVRLLPVLVAVGGIVLSLGGWSLVRRETTRSEGVRFERLTQIVADTVRARFDTAEHVLRGAATLVQINPHPTTAMWRTTVRDVGPILRQGLVGLGYVERIHRSQIPELTARERADGHPRFRVQDEVKHPELYVVTLMEPEAENVGALGVDIGRGVRRRGAADRAMNTGGVAMTDLFPIIRARGEVPGFLMFLPVYRAGSVPETAAERRRDLQGWVYSSLEAAALMKGVLDEMPVNMDCGVFQGDSTTTDHLIFDASGRFNDVPTRTLTTSDYAFRDFRVAMPFDINGQHWTILLSNLGPIDPESERLPWFILGGGLIITALSADARLGSGRPAAPRPGRGGADDGQPAAGPGGKLPAGAGGPSHRLRRGDCR